MLPRLATLKQQHAEHLLEVLHTAEKQEAERQRKLQRATSKANLAYLQKRFDAERRQSQTQISRLVQDADAVEAALGKAATSPLEHENDQKIYKGSCVEGGGNGGLSLEERKTGTGSTLSNAFVEPSEPREDPQFISTSKMRFMKYLYKCTEGENAAIGHHTHAATHVTGEGRSDKRRRRQACKGKGESIVLPSQGRDEGSSTLGGRGERTRLTASPNGTGRRRLLERKRGILLKLKGVVSRQAEALDRLVEGCADKNTRSTGSTRHIDGSRGRSESSVWSISQSSREGGSISIGRGKKGDRIKLNSARNAPPYDSTGVHKGTTTSSVTDASSRWKPPIPPRCPPENATSDFLARGGRWRQDGGHGVSRQSSVASSASYATYCDHGQGGREEVLGVGKRQVVVPVLTI